MSNEKQLPKLTQEQHDEWVKTQFARANKHLAENGVLFDSVATGQSRYLAPFVAVWKVKSLENKYYWVISGEVPVDFIADKAAKDARDALRYFSMHWQVKSENIRQSAGDDELKQKYAKLLQIGAENIYRTYSNEALWKDG